MILNKNVLRLVERAAIWAFLLVFAILGFMLRQALSDLESATSRVIAIEKAVAVIEGNRFTATDGMEMQRQLSVLAARMPSEFPPKTWLDTVYVRDQNSMEKALVLLTQNQQAIQDNQVKLQLTIEKVSTNQQQILDRLGKIEARIQN